MNQEQRDEQKKMGIGRFIRSFGYSIAGLRYAYKYEQSMFVHVLATIIVILAGIFFKLNLFEWLICVLVIGLVIATELINTSIEAVVDLSCPEIHPLAKVAKDTASAAVFVFAITAILCGGFVFLPKIIEFITTL